MKTLTIGLLALGFAALLGHFIAEDPGFVVIGYGDKVVRTSFVFFTVLLVLGIGLVYGTLRLIYQVLLLPKRWDRWTTEYRRRRSNKALGRGIVALAEGDFLRAEQLFRRGVDPELAPAAHYLGAAEAAQGLKALARRDTYLKLAHDALPGAEVAIGIKRAEMEIENRQLEQARATLTPLLERHPDNKQIMVLLREVYAETTDWRSLLELLPVLKRHRVFEKTELAQLEIDVSRNLLAAGRTSAADLDAVWEDVPKACRERPEVLTVYIDHLIESGRGEQAEVMLRKALSRDWDPQLIRQYGRVSAKDPASQLERAESWLATRARDPDLLLVLGRLSLGLELWGKAHSFLEQLIRTDPSPIAYRLIAQTAERMGDGEAATRYRREGLALATGGRVDGKSRTSQGPSARAARIG